MKILVIGSGGREHALVWKLRQSPRVEKVYCAPGNGGIAEEAEFHPVDVKSLDSMVALANHCVPISRWLVLSSPCSWALWMNSPGAGFLFLVQRRLQRSWRPAKVSRKSSCSGITSPQRITRSALRITMFARRCRTSLLRL